MRWLSLVLVLGFGAAANDLFAQVGRVDVNGRWGTVAVVDGVPSTVSHLWDGDWRADQIVNLGPVDETLPSFESGEPQCGPGICIGWQPNGPNVTRVRVVNTEPLRWTPRPQLGESGGVILQRGKAVGRVSARCGPFGCGVRIRSMRR